jgi:hypothetical protein
MKTNRLLEAETGICPSGSRPEPQRWRGARIRRRSGDKSTIKTLPVELMATPQFDSGRWKLRLERVSVSSHKQINDE